MASLAIYILMIFSNLQKYLALKTIECKSTIFRASIIVNNRNQDQNLQSPQVRYMAPQVKPEPKAASMRRSPFLSLPS